ncbi:MAG: hypothetical protein ACTSY1_01420 [Alphaproteobacteria bacterium]
MKKSDTQVRKRPPLLLALGQNDPPETVEIAGVEYRHQETVKHDSWAATAIYRDASNARIICKFNRIQPIFGFPMAWLGRILARRELGFLHRLADIDLVPTPLGAVIAQGRELKNVAARIYIAGDVFRVREQVDAQFFADLKQLLAALHAHDMAYVDLHKRENIVVDTRGRPNLIDFQVSFGLSPSGRGKQRVARFILAHLQEMDNYHYRKHYARCLGDTLTPQELQDYLKPPGFIRAHRKIAAPLRTLRRRLLVLMKVRNKSGMAHGELVPEEAFRPRPDDAATKMKIKR